MQLLASNALFRRPKPPSLTRLSSQPISIYTTSHNRYEIVLIHRYVQIPQLLYAVLLSKRRNKLVDWHTIDVSGSYCACSLGIGQRNVCVRRVIGMFTIYNSTYIYATFVFYCCVRYPLRSAVDTQGKIAIILAETLYSSPVH